MTVLLVAVAGAVGAVLRVAVDSLVSEQTPTRWPLGTTVVNAAGSLLLGAVTGLALAHGLPEPVRLAVGVGLCGALTTFSTASYEVVRLVQDGNPRLAAAYCVGSVLLCCLAAALGLWLTGGLAPDQPVLMSTNRE